MSTFILFVLHIFTLLSTTATGNENDDDIEEKHVFSVTEEGFHLDGKKFNIYAGEIHYFRIAACGWEDRLRKLQRAGLNTVSTAVEWAMHEPTPKNYDWSGDANFSRFVELAQNLNLFIIVRAGPYIGVDRNLGGIPGWLLTSNEFKDHPWVQRSSPEYRLYAERWLSHFLPMLSKMMVTNGGPVLMVQIDSDLGESKPCVTADWLHEIYTSYLGDKAVLFTMDNNEEHNLKCGKIQNTISAFRTDPWEYFTTFNQSIVKLFSALEKISPGSPKLMELRTGVAWYWEGDRFSFETENVMTTLKDLIDYDASIIIYMFAGGTNFERAGKSQINTMGMTTSYDFDAIISEAGDITEKFHKLKSILPTSEMVSNYEDVSEEGESSRDHYDISGELTFTSLGSFLDPVVRNNFDLIGFESQYPLSFTKLGVANGLVLYKTTIPENLMSHESSAYLQCKCVHDRGYVYVNGSLIGILDNIRHFDLGIPLLPGKTIQILVENSGYLAQSVIGEPKGIVSNVTLDNQVLTSWMMYALPLDNVEQLQDAARNMKPRKAMEEGNSFLLATFKMPPDIKVDTVHTYLNMKQSRKGQVFLNERSIGTYWAAGPQHELYIPGCYLKPEPMENRLLIIQMQKYQMPYDKEEKSKRSRVSGASRDEIDNLILYIILSYICWSWKPGYAFLCS